MRITSVFQRCSELLSINKPMECQNYAYWMGNQEKETDGKKNQWLLEHQVGIPPIGTSDGVVDFPIKDHKDNER